jgi:hypothetical protein
LDGAWFFETELRDGAQNRGTQVQVIEILHVARKYHSLNSKCGLVMLRIKITQVPGVGVKGLTEVSETFKKFVIF